MAEPMITVPSVTTTTATSPAPLRWWQVLRWYVDSVMGDNAYQRYVEHRRRHHPDEPVPTERQFWKDKHADAERNPKARCC